VKISVIIPHCVGNELALHQAISSVSDADEILVGNAPSYVKEWGKTVHVYEASPDNLAELLNAGISLASHPLLLFLIPWVSLDEGAIPSFLRVFSSLKYTKFGCLAPSAKFVLGSQATDTPTTTARLQTFCFLTTSKTVKSVGGFNTQFTSASCIEDFFLRLHWQGLSHIVTPEVSAMRLCSPDGLAKVTEYREFLKLHRKPRPVVLVTQKETEDSFRRLFDDVVSAEEDAPDGSWVFVLYPDEHAPQLTRERLITLSNPPNPFTVAYDFPVYNMWKDQQLWIPPISWERRMYIKGLSGAPDDATEVAGIRICRRTSAVRVPYLMPWSPDVSLTVATIMKNEEELLPSYLSHVVPAADRVFLVDTGSTDASVGLAEELGAEVVHQKFNDSFAEARNRYLKECKTTWLLHLDVDETVDFKELWPLLEVQTDAWQFPVRNLLRSGKSSMTDATRLFRDPSHWEYSGRVHETVDLHAFRYGKEVRRASTEIVHFGYLRERVSSKMRFYIKLNKKQMQENPDDPRPYFNLALHYLDAGKEDEAIDLLKTSVEKDPSFAMAWHELGACYCRKGLKCFENVMRLIPSAHFLSQPLTRVVALLKEYTRRETVDKDALEDASEPEE